MLIKSKGEFLIAKQDRRLLNLLEEKLDNCNLVFTKETSDPEYLRVTVIDKPTIAIGVEIPVPPRVPETTDDTTTSENKEPSDAPKVPVFCIARFLGLCRYPERSSDDKKAETPAESNPTEEKKDGVKS